MARAKTTTRRKSTSTVKSTTATTTRKAKPAAPKAAPVVVQEAAPVVSKPDLKKVELIDAVVERSGIKKKYAKPALEAALELLGEAIGEGRTLNLRPLGKVKVIKSKEVANGTVITTRVRRPLAKKDDGEGLADSAE